MTHSGADIAKLLSAHGLRPSRALGQNFVADPNTVRRIARLASLRAGDRVLEIGAGLGSLTLALAETGALVVAVETDRHVVPVLRSVVEPAGVEVVEGDALTLDLPTLLAAHGGGAWSLVANLPYNVATPLVMRTLTEVPTVTRLLVMVQREVGERMAAGVGDDGYGAVSVRVAYFARAEVVGRIPASVFIPRPARRVGARAVRATRGTRGRSRCRLVPAPRRGGTGRLRAAPEDVAPRAGGRRGARRLRARRRTTRGQGRGARRRRVGETGGVVKVHAPAKLTVSLRITGVRADGYHELDAEMVTLSLADELVLDEGGTGLTIEGDGWTRADALKRMDDNLVVKALVACGRRAAVRLRKRIPLGAGLGGGSADAAAILRWAGVTDAALAARLGADVPFCVAGGRARVGGVGERVSALEFERRDYLLLLPPFGVDTAAVYRAWDQNPDHDAPNDLAGAAMAAEPRLALWRDGLGDLVGSEPRLAGSGSTWFAEGGPPEAGTTDAPELRVGTESGRLVRVHTVPAGWEGD